MLAGAGLVLLAGAALGQPPEVQPDTARAVVLAPAPSAADSTAAAEEGARADTLAPSGHAQAERGDAGPARAPRARVRRGRFDTPGWVMLRSLVVPGWGQLSNGSWLKAVLLGGGEVVLITRLIQDDRTLRDLRAQADRARLEGDNETQNAAVEAYNSRLNQFVARQWLLGGLLVYALMDAYVDAHFRDFKVEFEHDPGLSGGAFLSGQTRLSLRWNF
jgi:hypothetical protein